MIEVCAECNQKTDLQIRDTGKTTWGERCVQLTCGNLECSYALLTKVDDDADAANKWNQRQQHKKKGRRMLNYFITYTYNDGGPVNTSNTNMALSHEITQHSITEKERELQSVLDAPNLKITFFSRLAD